MKKRQILTVIVLFAIILAKGQEEHNSLGYSTPYYSNDYVLLGLEEDNNKSYLELRQEYRDYCNQITIDTVIQLGEVKYKISDDLRPTLIDTVWSEVECRKYLNSCYDDLSVIGAYLRKCYSDTIFSLGYSSKPSKEIFSTQITRQKYCKVKQERETQEGFWDWVNKTYLK